MKKALLILTLLLFSPLRSFATSAAEYYTSGLQYYQQGQYDQAIEYCQYAIQVEPDYWQAYQVLGYCWYAKKDNVQALQYLDKSLQLNSNNPQLQAFDDKVRAATPAASTASPSAPGSSTPSTAPTQAPSASAISGRNLDLPNPGTINLEATVAYFYPGIQDLTNFYGGGTYTGVEEGVEVNLGADYVISPNFQLGVLLELMGKTPANVTIGFDEEDWNEYAVGGAGQANFLFPISKGMNFILHGEGGYYTLAGAHVAVSGADDGDVTLAASNAGWALAAGLEFVIGANKSWAVDVELGYRSLTFTPVTQGGQIDGTPQSGTLLNADNSNASLDFSGPRLSATARLF